ncbi:MAG TPA: response regulator [Bryobacteraceae bacterium]|jgi:CheY-like chemotaxis protein|nr:response regulator [Bryobacteraceae bacterium]
MPDKILFVDDDLNVLSGFQRVLRGRFHVETALNGEKALEKLRTDSEIAVIVSDYRMPAMNGVEFLTEASKEWPACIRILLTGEADTRAAGAAINQGQIFRFLLKPCPALILEKTLTAALKQYHLQEGEQALLEQTVRGSMELLVNVLSLGHPHVFYECMSIYQTLGTLLADHALPNQWEFEIAGLLSRLGHIAVPTDILEKRSRGDELSECESHLFASGPAFAASLITKIPRLEFVARIVAAQDLPLTDWPIWQPLQEMDRFIVGSQLLHVSTLWNLFKIKEQPMSIFLWDLQTRRIAPALIKSAEKLKLPERVLKVRVIRASELESGMTLASDLMSDNGLLLLAKGSSLSPVVVECLKRRVDFRGLDKTVEIVATTHSSMEHHEPALTA